MNIRLFLLYSRYIIFIFPVWSPFQLVYVHLQFMLGLVLLNGLRVLLLTRLDNDKNEQPVAFSSRK